MRTLGNRTPLRCMSQQGSPMGTHEDDTWYSDTGDGLLSKLIIKNLDYATMGLKKHSDYKKWHLMGEIMQDQNQRCCKFQISFSIGYPLLIFFRRTLAILLTKRTLTLSFDGF